MKISRTLSLLSLQLLLAAAWAGAALAQGYPNKPIRVIVPFPAGGTSDVMIRVVGEGMTAMLGQPIVVENRPGGGTLIASEAVARSAPDGYTLLHFTSTAVTASELNPPSFNIYTDLVPIAQVVEVYALMMVVGEAVPAKTMAELISFARANPGKLTMGYSGFGNPAHILGELLNRREKLGLQLVSYKGTVDTQNDLMAGRISMMTAPLTNVAEAVKSGKLKVLAAVGDKRNPLAPEVPTLTEIGIRELAFALWSGFHAPAGTPAAVLARAERGVEAGTKAPQAADRLRAISAAPAYLSGAQFAEVIKRDSATIRKMLDDSGIKEQARRNEGQK